MPIWRAGQKHDARDMRNVLELGPLARETAARVACGADGKAVTRRVLMLRSEATCIQLGGVPETPLRVEMRTSRIADDAPLRCADRQAQQQMVELSQNKTAPAIRSV